MTRRVAVVTVAVVLAFAACDVYDRPNRPLPATMELQTLDGRTLRAADLAGRPWVINIWVPG